MTGSEINPAEEFQDPLENYDPEQFDDPIEQALHDEQVSALQTSPHTCVSADTTVRETMKLMVGRQITCVLVEKDGFLVGVFSDRDVLNKVALEYDELADTPVGDVMSPRPIVLREDDSVARALSIMAVSGYRHIPVVDPENHPIGILSPQRVEHFLGTRMQA